MRLLPLCFLLLTAQANAQLVDFADTTGRWSVADTYPNGSMQDPGFTATETTVFFYEGDTLLGLDQWSVMMARPSVEGGGDPEPVGFARTVGDIVLFRDMQGIVDTLYDFSIQPGDSVSYPEPVAGFLQVDQVSTVIVAGVPHRIIDFEPFLEQIPSFIVERWIEGVGSVHGPLFPRFPRNFGTEVPGDSLKLTCYERDGTLLWSHSDYADCTVNILQSVGDLGNSQRALRSWPNPGTDELQVAWENRSIRTVILSDLQGRTVQQLAMGQAQGSLNTSRLAEGVYTLLVIGQDGSRATGKWVKE
jgi:hypothetical protein